MKRRKFMAASVGFGTAAIGVGWKIIDNYAAPGTVLRSDPRPFGQRLYRGVDLAFGTSISVQLLHSDEKQANLAIEDAFAAARRIDSLMSIYRQDSQVFMLNATGVLDRPDPHLCAVLNVAKDLSELTGGAFDVTVQSLWAAYKNAWSQGGLPTTAERDSARMLADSSQLVFDERRVELRRPGMAVTLNGIAQGYATDLALAAVRARGIRHALLDIGEYGAVGARDEERPWLLGIQDPRKYEALARTLRMDGRTVATSGDYESIFAADFSQHHILDPRTGCSPPELASVSVVAPTAVLADGLSTALMVMGPARAMKLVAGLDKVDALLIDKSGARWESPGFPWS
jgi:FAD:protein FMN transferase